MIVENDCSAIVVGSIQFLEWPQDHPRGIIVALCEADPIVVADGGRIAMYDHANPDHEVLECAADSERFLEGLATFLRIIKDRENWRGRAEEASNKCADLAGGSTYSHFFRMLFGSL